MADVLNLYVIPRRTGGFTLFSTPGDLAAIEAEAADHLGHFIEWVTHRRNRFVAWLGRVLRSAHEYYVRLEDKIDPVERVLKAMASTKRFVVYAPDAARFERICKRQRWKHAIWFSVDFLLVGVVVLASPILVPIPGPNIFLYYPFLRLLSHYRALRGAFSGLKSRDIEFKDLPELRGLEDNLPGLTRFLERMD